MEHKSFKLKLKDINDQGIFEGYASVFGNIDLVGDIVERGAFKKTVNENPHLPILWQHHIDQPIGITKTIEEDGHGLKVVGELNLETVSGKEAYSLLKQGAIKGLSIGYQIIKDTIKEGVRYLKELKLLEYSLVTIPANEQAQVMGVKQENTAEDVLQNLDSILFGKADSVKFDIDKLIKKLEVLKYRSNESSLILAESQKSTPLDHNKSLNEKHLKELIKILKED